MLATLTQFSELTNLEIPMPSRTVIFQAFLILLCSAVMIPILLKLTGKLLEKSQKLHLLQGYILSTCRIILWFFALLMTADSIGLPVNSIFALLGVVGIALSLALQNTLSNFAGGLQVLASQPFQVGDFVDTDQGSGTVSEIGLAYCKLSTTDNKEILVPNALMASSKIINHSANGNRRVDLLFPASYDLPSETVRQVILAVVANYPQVHQDPPPVVYLSEFGDSAILYSLRVWTDNQEYWNLHFHLKEAVYLAFQQQNMEIPFPQLVVHGSGHSDLKTLL